MGKIIAVANQKGGVGKTTTSVNLSASLAATKHRVLLIDMDPQGNATMGCGHDKAKLNVSCCDLLLNEVNFDEVVVNLKQLNLDIIPANSDLTAAEVELLSIQKGREGRLSEMVRQHKDQYEYIIIDCPPSLNMLTLNALVAADTLLIPMQCEYFALEGLSALMDTLSNIQERINPKLKLEGVLRTMYDGRSRLTREVSEELVRHFNDKVFRTFIPRNIRLAEAPSHGMPVIHYDKSSKGALAYLALASEIVRRDEKESNFSNN